MKTKRPNKIGNCGGLTMVEVLTVIVVVACLFLFAGMLIPVSSHAPGKAKRAICQNNLKQVGLAFRTWELDYGNKFPMSVSTNKGGTMEWGAGTNMFRHFQVMSNELNNPKIVVCPADNRNQAVDFTAFNNKNVSYFVGLDTDETFPNMPISGDRNLITNGVAADTGLAVIRTNDIVGFSKAMHDTFGNVGLADGSVQQVSVMLLNERFQKSGTNVNRLAIP